MSASETDLAKLWARPMLDTGVLMRALEGRGEHWEVCQALWKSLEKSGHTVLVAAPSITELERTGTPSGLERHASIEFIPFDYRAAVIASQTFPQAVLDRASDEGLSRTYMKFDSLIVACALRGKATCLVTLDGKLSGYLKDAISCISPDAYPGGAQHKLDV